MPTINIHEAKTQFSRLLLRVIIAKSGKPIAKLVPIKRQPHKRIAGIDAGNAWIAEDFDAPLPKDLRTYFE
jgi:antitoxin (DNA-binding transcriptional repressor) of toxin-antitoxin stability system